MKHLIIALALAAATFGFAQEFPPLFECQTPDPSQPYRPVDVNKSNPTPLDPCLLQKLLQKIGITPPSPDEPRPQWYPVETK